MKAERRDTSSQLSCNKAITTHCQEAEGEALIQVIMPRLQRKSAEKQAGARTAPSRTNCEAFKAEAAQTQQGRQPSLPESLSSTGLGAWRSMI